MEKDRKEGIKGMANPGRYGIERVAYWLMRITGLGLLFYFIGHIYEHTIESILRAEKLGGFKALPASDIFNTCNCTIFYLFCSLK